MILFLSSTGKDLSEYREAVIRAIQSFPGFECDAMENWGARDSEPAEFDDMRVRRCDLAIFLVGHRFGNSPRGRPRRSYTQLEYDLAERLNKPRLVFFAADDFAMPVVWVESDRLRNRQQAFRKEIRGSGKRIVAEFRSPEELETKVVQALHNWEEDRQFRARVRQHLARPQQPNRGALVQKLCDRHRQEERFFDFLCDTREQNRNTPMMCILPGAEGECHGSLVERFSDTLSRIMAESKSKARPTPVKWEYAGPLVPRFWRLVQRVTGSFERSASLTPAKPTAEEFRRCFRGSPDALLVIQHHVPASLWSVSTTRLLMRYRRYWGASAGSAEIPVIVFVNVVYPALRVDRDSNHIAPGARILRRARTLWICAQLRLLSWRSGCPCLVLDELKPIRRQELDEWMVNNQVFDTEQERIEALDEVFPPDGEESRIMALVEKFCGAVLAPEARDITDTVEDDYAGELVRQ